MASLLEQLIEALRVLPGVGPKSAQRIAYHLLKLPTEDALRLARSISEAKARITFCTRCFNIAEGDSCSLCLDDRRDRTVLCVVEDPPDIVAVDPYTTSRATGSLLLVDEVTNATVGAAMVR